MSPFVDNDESTTQICFINEQCSRTQLAPSEKQVDREINWQPIARNPNFMFNYIKPSLNVIPKKL